ncbi:uncharacterized protein G2W53_043286 [Senna tora]|uniref:Uncharacterized protein n=1 Tax=Senna tora TaxID=362788 RepID=A0A834SGS6_9FABA|nr:uncharacterized protein G2W53_043286 [Senna tora]
MREGREALKGKRRQNQKRAERKEAHTKGQKIGRRGKTKSHVSYKAPLLLSLCLLNSNESLPITATSSVKP